MGEWRNADETKGQSPVNLLKHLEQATATLFRDHQLFEAERHTLGTKQEQIRCRFRFAQLVQMR